MTIAPLTRTQATLVGNCQVDNWNPESGFRFLIRHWPTPRQACDSPRTACRTSAPPKVDANECGNGLGFRGMFRLGHYSFLECVNDGNIIVAPRSCIRQGWTIASLLFRITRPPVPQRNGASTVTGCGVKRKPLMAGHHRIAAFLADQQPDGLCCPGIACLRDPATYRSAVPSDRCLRDVGGVAG